MTAQPITVTVAGDSVTVNTDVTIGGVGPPPAGCAYTNPNEPTDDPNPPYNGTFGRKDVSAAPVPAGYPTPLTTGLCGAGISVSDLSPSGGMTITADGTIIDGLDITGQVTINANNVTIRNSRITSTSAYAVLHNKGYTGLLIEDTRIRSIDGSDPIAVNTYSPSTFRRIHVTGGHISLMAHAGMLVEDSYMTGTYHESGAHRDIIWVGKGNGYIVRRNSAIQSTASGTAAFFFHTQNGPLDGLLVEDNYLSGGGYCIYTESTNGTMTNAIVQNNRFELGSWRWGWKTNSGGAVYTGNVQMTSG